MGLAGDGIGDGETGVGVQRPGQARPRSTSKNGDKQKEGCMNIMPFVNTYLLIYKNKDLPAELVVIFLIIFMLLIILGIWGIIKIWRD